RLDLLHPALPDRLRRRDLRGRRRHGVVDEAVPSDPSGDLVSRQAAHHADLLEARELGAGDPTVAFDEPGDGDVQQLVTTGVALLALLADLDGEFPAARPGA